MKKATDYNVSQRQIVLDGGEATLPRCAYNKWTGLFFNVHHPADESMFFNSTRYSTTAAAHAAFEDSPMSLSIPVGLRGNDRVGREVNVIKDSWLFKLRVPSVDDGGLVAGNWVPAINLSNRPVTVRLIGIMQPHLAVPGELGFTPDQLFEDSTDLNTRFNRDDARGYRVFFDETHRFAMCPTTLDSVSGDAGADVDSPLPLEKKVAAKLRYVRRWSDASTELTAPDSGWETTTAANDDLGIMTNGITWYIYIKDDAAPVKAGLSSSTYPDWRSALHHPLYFEVEVFRNTRYTDS